MSCECETCAESKKSTSESENTYNFENELNKFVIAQVVENEDNYKNIKEIITFIKKNKHVLIDIGYKINSHNKQLIIDAIQRLFGMREFSINGSTIMIKK